MADENTALTFNGVDGLDCYEFIQAIRRYALDEGKSRDDAWIADMVSLRFSGPALKWFESLDDDSQRDWKLLRQAIVRKYGDPRDGAETWTRDLDAKRILIRNWNDTTRRSEVGFPTTEGEWMARGRERRDGMTSSAPWTMGWFFVENGEPIPLHAIPTGHESGGPLFSIRIWHEGGLSIGKHGRQHKSCLIPWYGKEIYREGHYEILVGDPAAVRWVRPRCGPFTAVEGGFEVVREDVLLLTQTEKEGTWQPGKGFVMDGVGRFGWRLIEHEIPLERIKVLAWAT